jgi:hypothetical protein
MNRFFVLVFSLLGLLFLGKGLELWMALDKVDANGMTIEFLGIMVVEHVVKDSIPSFALGFTVAAVIPFLMATTFAIKSTYALRKEQHKM